jgi:hypothetical protein
MTCGDLDIMLYKEWKDFFQCGGGDRKHYGKGNIYIMEVGIGHEAQFSLSTLWMERVDLFYCIRR